MGRDVSINGPLSLANVRLASVWFTGSTALTRGMGVCFDHDRTGDGADEPDATRQSYVELPSATNARFFAGVVVRDYAAVSTGQMIEIAVPGSVVEVLLYGPSVTNNSQLVTCQAGGTYAGYFTRAGYEGEGTAVPLQTCDASSTAGRCLCKLQEGTPSGLVEVLTPTGGALGTILTGGVTYIAACAPSEDPTYTLGTPSPAVEGLRKKFELEGTVTTYDFKLTVTSGLQVDGSTALASIDDLDTDGDLICLRWDGGRWQELYSTGGTKA